MSLKKAIDQYVKDAIEVYKTANNQVRFLDPGDIICVDACNNFTIEINDLESAVLFEAEIISNHQIGQYSHVVFKILIHGFRAPERTLSLYVRPWTRYTKPQNA